MRNNKAVGFIVFAMLGAVMATTGDAFHVRTQTLSYPNPFLFGQAWWVFPGFALAFLFMGSVYSLVARRLPFAIQTRMSRSRGSLRDMIEAGMAFLLVYLLSGYGNYEPAVLSVIFYGMFAVRLAFTYERAWLLLLSVMMAAGGMVVEGLMAEAGWVAYRHVDVINVPYWLGGLYLHGAFALREGLRRMYYRNS